MAVDFKKLFADTTKYPDTIQLQLGDATVSLGDLRQYDASAGGALQAELKLQQDALAADRLKLEKAGEQVAQTYLALEAEKARLAGAQPPPAASTDPLARYEADEVFRPVVTHMRGIEAQNKAALEAVTSKLDQVVKSIAQMGTTYMGDKARMDFSAIPTDDPVRPKDLTLDSLYKFAVERQVYDRNNLPDLREAYNRLTADARHTYDIAAAEQRGRDAATLEAREGAMLPRPSSGLPALPEGMKPPINIGDAFGKAASDKDLWKQINMATGSLQ